MVVQRVDVDLVPGEAVSDLHRNVVVFGARILSESMESIMSVFTGDIRI